MLLTCSYKVNDVDVELFTGIFFFLLFWFLEHETLNVPQLLAPDICLNLRLPTEISEKPLSPSASDTVLNLKVLIIPLC